MTAMAMSCRPDLIIFDEPTTALDVTTQVEVLAAMRDIVEQFNTAAIYITHDLAVVAQMAHRIMVLRHGKEVEQAPTREMLKEPKEDYTKTLWAVRKLGKPESISDDIVLRVHDVDASYGRGMKVLDNVTVQLPRGRTVAVVGESGSGKSTLARAITGLLPPTKGEIYFNGKPLPRALKDRDKDTLRRIQMIYQSADTSLNPRQTVRDHHRPPDRVLSRPDGRGVRPHASSSCWTPIELDGTATSIAFPANCRADRSSASPLRGRWPPSPRSSSATR